MLNNDRDDHLWALDLDALRKAFRKFAQEHDIAASEWGEQAQRFLEKQRDRTREATATEAVGNSFAAAISYESRVYPLGDQVCADVQRNNKRGCCQPAPKPFMLFPFCPCSERARGVWSCNGAGGTVQGSISPER